MREEPYSIKWPVGGRGGRMKNGAISPADSEKQVHSICPVDGGHGTGWRRGRTYKHVLGVDFRQNCYCLTHSRASILQSTSGSCLPHSRANLRSMSYPSHMYLAVSCAAYIDLNGLYCFKWPCLRSRSVFEFGMSIFLSISVFMCIYLGRLFDA